MAGRDSGPPAVAGTGDVGKGEGSPGWGTSGTYQRQVESPPAGGTQYWHPSAGGTQHWHPPAGGTQYWHPSAGGTQHWHPSGGVGEPAVGVVVGVAGSWHGCRDRPAR